jgi:hypothetical protein
MPGSGWLVLSLLTEEGEFSTGVTGTLNYLSKNQAGYEIGDVL